MGKHEKPKHENQSSNPSTESRPGSTVQACHSSILRAEAEGSQIQWETLSHVNKGEGDIAGHRPSSFGLQAQADMYLHPPQPQTHIRGIDFVESHIIRERSHTKITRS